MSKNPASDFYELKRPRTLVGAMLRFLIFVAIAAGILIASPNSWGEWTSGLITGLAAGTLWAVSWKWKGVENRVLIWLVIFPGGMACWGILYGDIPSFGALACAYVGFEFVLLILHSQLRAWTDPRNQQKEAE